MRTLTVILQHHFSACFQMLLNLISDSPQSQWNTGNENTSIWKRVLHALESVDYWLSDDSSYLFHNHFPEMSAEMDQKNKHHLSKEEISFYCTLISEKAESFFSNMNDGSLASLSNTHSHLTNLDIILCQIRHIQNNTGYCSQQLRTATGFGIEWVGYKES